MKAYGYIRVSTDSQGRSGLGLAAQKAIIADGFRPLKRKGVRWGAYYTDPAVSGRKPFAQRPKGRELNAVLHQGDHLLIAKLDRAFRNLGDFVQQLASWTKRGIYVHLLDLSVDTSTPTGKLIAEIMAAIAEWESRRIGERIREAKEVQRGRGVATNGRAPLGFRIGRRGRLAPDAQERKVMRRVVTLRRRGLEWRVISAMLATEGFRPRRKRKWTRDNGRWNGQRAWRLYHAALELRLVRR